MPTLTDDLYVATNAVYDLLDEHQTAIGLEDIWLGDQTRVPRTPAAVVEPGGKSREFNGSPRRFKVSFQIFVMLFFEKVTDSGTSTRESLQIAELIESVLHQDATFDGLFIHSFVEANEPGYATRDNTKMRAARLTLNAVSQEMLPYPP